MRKLHLRLDELEVQSFETHPALRKGDGTVDAHETFDSECVCDTDRCGGGTYGRTCPGCDTPGYTCEDNCTSSDPIDQAARDLAAW